MGRRIATIGAAVVLGLLAPLLATAPASAESVTAHDPHGDSRLGYDIYSLQVAHLPGRVRLRLEQSQTPYFYYLYLDVPGGRSWDYLLTWDVYTPRNLDVQTRRQVETEAPGSVCRPPKSARTTSDNHVLWLKFQRSCIGNPSSLRVRGEAWDDEFGRSDKIGWGPRAQHA